VAIKWIMVVPKVRKYVLAIMAGVVVAFPGVD
jgi:hypothetical protein